MQIRLRVCAWTPSRTCTTSTCSRSTTTSCRPSPRGPSPRCGPYKRCRCKSGRVNPLGFILLTSRDCKSKLKISGVSRAAVQWKAFTQTLGFFVVVLYVGLISESVCSLFAVRKLLLHSKLTVWNCCFKLHTLVYHRQSMLQKLLNDFSWKAAGLSSGKD